MSRRLRTPPRRLTFLAMKLVFSILVALALLLMPAGMGGAGAAMAAPSQDHVAMSAGGGHCPDMPEPASDQPPERCCVLACSIMLAEPVRLAPAPRPAFVHAAPNLADLHGLSFEAATPPPRFS